MTPEQLETAARKAGLLTGKFGESQPLYREDLLSFAALVENVTLETVAKMCDEKHDSFANSSDDYMCGYANSLKELAAAIRAMKKPTSDEPKPCWFDVQGISEPNVSCGDCPNRDYKVPKARIEAPLGVPIDPWTPEELEALDKVLAEDTPDPQLRKFYGVHTYPELVTAMEHHIERLQAKLPKTDSTIRFTREG